MLNFAKQRELMSDHHLQEEALEQLRTIRGLMERANVYRSISGPAALSGGVLSLVTAGIVWFLGNSKPDWEPGVGLFLLVWLAVLLFSSAINLTLLGRRSGREGEPFWSSGMQATTRALWPGFGAGGIFGVLLITMGEGALGNIPLCVLIWMLGYGAAVLATGTFAPPSLRLLGGTFVVSALIGLALHLNGSLLAEMNPVVAGSLLMGATFGFFHLIYGVVVLLGRSDVASKESIA